MVPGGFPLAEMHVATGVFRLDERATSVGVDRLIWVVGRTEGIGKYSIFKCLIVPVCWSSRSIFIQELEASNVTYTISKTTFLLAACIYVQINRIYVVKSEEIKKSFECVIFVTISI